MLKHPKAGSLPYRKKPLSLGEATERDTESVTLQDAVAFSKGGCKPGIRVIVWHTPAVPGLVAHQIRRIGQHHIHAASRQLRQHGQAITRDHLIKKRVEERHRHEGGEGGGTLLACGYEYVTDPRTRSAALDTRADAAD